MSKLAHLVEEIELILEQEKVGLSEIDNTSNDYHITVGWIEALQYVLEQIEVLH